jgi:hypothetical protein
MWSKSSIFLKEGKFAFKKPTPSQNGGSWTLLLPSLCGEGWKGILTILRPDVCSNIGVVYTVAQTTTRLWGDL